MASASGIPRQAEQSGGPCQAQKSELRVRMGLRLAEALPWPSVSLPLGPTWIQSPGKSVRVWAW